VSDDVPNFFEKTSEFRYLKLNVKDFGADKGISRVFQTAYEYVEEARRNHGKVLVHCAAGLNRSATVTIALKMLLENLTLKEAAESVKRMRSQIAPFKDNREELLKFEMKIRGCNSLTREELNQLLHSRQPQCTRSQSAGREMLTKSLPNVPRIKSSFSFPTIPCSSSPTIGHTSFTATFTTSYYDPSLDTSESETWCTTTTIIDTHASHRDSHCSLTISTQVLINDPPTSPATTED